MTKTIGTPEFEQLLRTRLNDFADHAPTTVRSIDDLTLRPVEAERPRKKRIAGIGALVIALGGGFALTTIAATGGQDGGGTSTPEQAVERFIGALEDRDVLGALDVLDPAESSVLVDIVRDAATEGSRVGLFSDDVDLGEISGTTVTLDGLVTSTTNLAPDLAVVHLDQGLLTVDTDLATLPLGDFVRNELTVQNPGSNVPTDFAAHDYVLATVQRNGQWYVSISYTIAEAARQSSGADFPAEAGIQPEGFDSAEAAATAFWTRLAAFDIRGAASTVSPGEGDALLRYAPLWLPSVDSALAGARSDGFSVSISGLTYDVGEARNGQRMAPTGYVIEGTMAPTNMDFEQPVFDADAPTLVYNAHGDQFVYVAAGEPIPETLDSADFVSEFPVELQGYDGPINSAGVNRDGSLQPYWSETSADPALAEGPQAFRYELADGCTTLSGPAFAATGNPLFGGYGIAAPTASEIEPGVWQLCADATPIDSISSLSMFVLIRSGSAAPHLPSIDVVEVDGQWYVSPIGSIFGSITDTLGAIGDDQILSIDSPIAPFLYGTGRAGLEATVIGQAVADLDPSCKSVVVTDTNGIVTGLLVDLAVDDVQQCFSSGFSSFGTVDYATEVSTSAIADEIVPASTAYATEVSTSAIADEIVPASTEIVAIDPPSTEIVD